MDQNIIDNSSELELQKIQNFKGTYPKQLWYLFLIEMWERFCFYGMRALLGLYISHLILSLNYHPLPKTVGVSRQGTLGNLGLNPIADGALVLLKDAALPEVTLPNMLGGRSVPPPITLSCGGLSVRRASGCSPGAISTVGGR